MNILMEMLPFFALGALGIATFVVASGALRSALRAEKQGEDRFELLRDQQERLELLREERRVLTEELEFERRERLEAQKRVKQLMREHPHLELEREIQRLTEELERAAVAALVLRSCPRFLRSFLELASGLRPAADLPLP